MCSAVRRTVWAGPYYRENPIDIINFWGGGFRGLGIYGGLAGGILAILIYCRYQKLSPLQYFDFIAPNVLLAQAVGRLGNWVNQELYGPPYGSRLGVPHQSATTRARRQRICRPTIQDCGALNLTQDTLDWYASNGFHPTFFYEALWNLALWGVLMVLIWQFGDRMRRGDALWLYLGVYGLGRFWVEMFRPDAWVMGRLATAQWIAVGSVVFSMRHVGRAARGLVGGGAPEESLKQLSRHRGEGVTG